MSEYLAAYLGITIVVGTFVGLAALVGPIEELEISNHAKVTIVVFAPWFWPLVVGLLVICTALYLPYAVARGTAEIWRIAFPAKVKVPRAVARTTKSGEL